MNLFASVTLQIDPLDDESIPQYKKWKKRGSRWVHILQWTCLVIVCVLFGCSVRVKSMRNKYWYNIVLWQWFTLLLVVTCGRLIAGWAVQVRFFPPFHPLYHCELIQPGRKFSTAISHGATRNCMQFLVLLIERHFLLKRRVLYFVYGLRHSFKNCIWVALVIATWKVILRDNTDQNTVPVITKVCQISPRLYSNIISSS